MTSADLESVFCLISAFTMTEYVRDFVLHCIHFMLTFLMIELSRNLAQLVWFHWTHKTRSLNDLCKRHCDPPIKIKILLPLMAYDVWLNDCRTLGSSTTAMLLVFIGHSFFTFYGQHLSNRQCRLIHESQPSGLAKGLAMGFVSFLENMILDENTHNTAFKGFIERELSGSGSIVGSYQPLLLFPDLTSELYVKYLRKESVSLVSGLIEVDKEESHRHTEDFVQHAKMATYDYVDKAGLPRKSYFVVIKLKCLDETDRDKRLFKYFFVADNRPLLSIQFWYLSKYEKDTEESLKELKILVEDYKRSILDGLLANKQVRDWPKSNYKAIEFGGLLTHAIRDLETKAK